MRAGDPACARVRRYVVEHALRERVRLRGLHLPGAQADWRARGGHSLPALWDGHALHQGSEAVLARLQAAVNLGRDD